VIIEITLTAVYRSRPHTLIVLALIAGSILAALWQPSPVEGDERPMCPQLVGDYALRRAESPRGEPVTRMRVSAQHANRFTVGGQDWSGDGVMEGADGHYDWRFHDGRMGRTTVRVGRAGRLHGHVVGSGIDWHYIGERSSGPIRFAPCGPP